MNPQTTGFDEYLHALRDLDNVRDAQEQSAAALARQQSQTHANLAALWQRVNQQRDLFSRLAIDCGLPPVATRPQPSPKPADPHAELTIAANEIEAADTGFGDARYLAHRPKFLPRWRADDRNGLIYGVYALIALIVQVSVLATAAGTESLGDMVIEVLTAAVMPLPAWAAGWLTIGLVSKPLLGEGTLAPNGKLVRNPRMGAVICFSTWIVSCALGNIYLKLARRWAPVAGGIFATDDLLPDC